MRRLTLAFWARAVGDGRAELGNPAARRNLLQRVELVDFLRPLSLEVQAYRRDDVRAAQGRPGHHLPAGVIAQRHIADVFPLHE